jgi:hypothetical protein
MWAVRDNACAVLLCLPQPPGSGGGGGGFRGGRGGGGYGGGESDATMVACVYVCAG